jgi:hypothetical protein
MIEWLAGLRIMKEVPGLAAWAESIVARTRRAGVARDLATIIFWDDGLLAPLRAVASGDQDKSHFRSLKSKLEQFDAKVDEAVKRLMIARDSYVAIDDGMLTAHKLDSVLNMKMGTGQTGGEIRSRIRRLAKHDLEIGQTAQEAAQALVKDIAIYNSKLDEVHETIRPKAKGSSPASHTTTTAASAPRGKRNKPT